MRLFPLLPPLLVLPTLARAAGNKRGLVQVETNYPQDEKIFLTAPTTISWYYSYHSAPSASLAALEFVPMLWGEPATADYDFATEVRGLLRDEANRITCVLGFNEPDMGGDVGGSNMTPARAVELWKRMIEPLKDEGLKLGAPAVAGSANGKAWLKEFVDKCDNCTVDFIPIHWYGNFEGFASYIGEIREMFPDKDLWVTEFGFAHQSIDATHTFFNSSIEYLDRLDYVQRYSWFGSFRSSVSNVGPNVAMLDEYGGLTDLGAWYLGRQPTRKTPARGSASAAQAPIAWTSLGVALGVAVVAAAFS